MPPASRWRGQTGPTFSSLTASPRSADARRVHAVDAAAQNEDDVQVALDPSELDNLDADTFRAKYEQQRTVRDAIRRGADAQRGTSSCSHAPARHGVVVCAVQAAREEPAEDFSDLVAEHAAKESKKRKKAQDTKASASKKVKDFKF